MKCEHIRELLPLHAYGDIEPDERMEVEEHLHHCATCRAERAAFTEVQRALSAMPTPAVAIGATRLLVDASTRRARRWRRVALAGSAIAATLLMFTISRCELRAGDGQFSITWGRRESPAPAAPVAHASRSVDEVNARLQQLDELTRALASDIYDRDHRRVGDIENLRTRLDILQRLSTAHWQEARRDVEALYAVHFKPVAKGDVP